MAAPAPLLFIRINGPGVKCISALRDSIPSSSLFTEPNFFSARDSMAAADLHSSTICPQSGWLHKCLSSTKILVNVMVACTNFSNTSCCSDSIMTVYSRRARKLTLSCPRREHTATSVPWPRCL
ncbi:uncharacterized protein LOC127876127 [Dreissena polymorpha]|uniref:uncharacterized protein LOC127876127 n=1 Tax=Dreissena polymorpha TaxID=45954 RepID=UPI002264C8CA|nr:uncharacterized protein LOC127876127 [Dreissena polymorpha]